MKASGGRLTAEATGEIESDDGVLVVKRIHVVYSLRLDSDADHEKAHRAFAHHMPHCPVYRSIGSAIEITTALEVVAR
ncbi:MAG: OsmC family protein [Actinobacteria bacterium]|nr:OsmC family protein [Actinomycetota bacterium]